MSAEIIHKDLRYDCLLCSKPKSILHVYWIEGSDRHDVSNDTFCEEHAKAYIKALLETYGQKEHEDITTP